MRPPLPTGEIGDGISLAMHDGIIGEIGSVRIYDPIKPFDVSEGDDETIRPALFQTCEAIPFMPSPLESVFLYPMTCYQRMYQWPPVGPMPYDGERNVSLPPVEVPAGQDQWSLQPVACLAINRTSNEVMPELDGQPLDTETIIPQRGNRRRDYWTVRKTMPMVPTVFLRMPFEGDSRRFKITGITKDSAGTPVGGCRVVAYETATMGYGLSNSVDGETVSDGSGNYSIDVSSNPITYTVIAYKAGSPDVAGITRNDVTGA